MKRAFFALVLLFATVILSSQEKTVLSIERDVPPPPVVSGLVAVPSGARAILSWTAAPVISGESLVFRSNRPITAATFSSAEKRGTVPWNVTNFEDPLENDSDYFYAVLSREADGTLYEFFLPVSNTLLVGVSSGSKTEPAREAQFSVFDIMTRNDAVIITWKASIESRNLVLYRSTSPFTGLNSLVQAIVVSTFEDSGTPYVDYPVPGVPYYYAILDEDVLRTGTAYFTAGSNTNRIPVEIPSGFARIQKSGMPNLRPMPLPYLNPSRDSPGQAWRFSAAVEKMVGSLLLAPTGTIEPVRAPFIFRSDLESVSGGEEYALKKILEADFTVRAWDTAIDSLTQFLSIRRTAETVARTHFYLGEAYYFTGNFRKALPEFLLAQDIYYNQSREWIQYVMDRLVAVE